MGVDFSIAVFYGIIIDDDIEVDNLESFGLEGIDFYENSGFGISADGYYKIHYYDEYFDEEEIIPTTNLKALDEKFIKFLQANNITKFKGPALFIKGIFS
jgi:hypothetical protein